MRSETQIALYAALKNAKFSNRAADYVIAVATESPNYGKSREYDHATNPPAHVQSAIASIRRDGAEAFIARASQTRVPGDVPDSDGLKQEVATALGDALYVVNASAPKTGEWHCGVPQSAERVAHAALFGNLRDEQLYRVTYGVTDRYWVENPDYGTSNYNPGDGRGYWATKVKLTSVEHVDMTDYRARLTEMYAAAKAAQENKRLAAVA